MYYKLVERTPVPCTRAEANELWDHPESRVVKQEPISDISTDMFAQLSEYPPFAVLHGKRVSW